MICVAVDGGGYIVHAVGEVYPACSEFALVTASHFDRLTYWADLSIELDPSGAVFPVMLGAMLTAVGVVLGLRLVVSLLRTSSNEA